MAHARKLAEEPDLDEPPLCTLMMCCDRGGTMRTLCVCGFLTRPLDGLIWDHTAKDL